MATLSIRCAKRALPMTRFSTRRLLNNHTSQTPIYPEVIEIDSNQKDWASRTLGGFVKVNTVKPYEPTRNYSPIFLRDLCTCPKCVDPSTTQKIFNTARIPSNIKVKELRCSEDAVQITWENDVAGYEGHVTEISKSKMNQFLSQANYSASNGPWVKMIAWSKKDVENLKHINYRDYMEDDETLLEALSQLHSYGLLFLKDAPQDEKTVEKIATRIGSIRDSFYGRTWDVKSVPQAKNVAYTQQYLGLHMDLLYMHNPPGFQFLHCLKNQSTGGESLFSDSFKAFFSLDSVHRGQLEHLKYSFKYDNDGENYKMRRSFVKKTKNKNELSMRSIRNISYSPPFQGPIDDFSPLSPLPDRSMRAVEALKAFADETEKEENLLEYRYREGDCVIFNNRRVLHGRREFDASSGERWLKGCYIDTDAFYSRFNVLRRE